MGQTLESQTPGRHVLIVDDDPLFAAVLEDRLIALGHRPQTLRLGHVVAHLSTDTVADLLILRAHPPDSDELTLLDILRAQPATQRLPILVLAETSDSQVRIESLRRGADDFLAMPCDLEELMLRAERLIGRGEQHSLEGDLGGHHPWELVQYIRNAGKTGRLTIQSELGKGRLAFRQGAVCAAQWHDLADQEAMLAVLGLHQGRFRFVAGEDAVTGVEVQNLNLQEALLRSAWIEDELQQRLEKVPATGEPLMTTARPVPGPEARGDLAFLPVDAVHAAIGPSGETRLFDLQKQLPYAPQTLRLAVAWLVEQGAVAARAQTESFPTTGELTSVAMLDIAVTAYLQSARNAGLGTTALPFLILAEPSVWPRLVELFETLPGLRRRPELVSLVERLRQGKGGSVTLASDTGKLSLTAQVLSEGTRSSIEAILTVCASVFVWLGDNETPELTTSLLERLDRARSAGRGLLVVDRTTSGVDRLRQAVEGSKSWELSTHAPYSLLGILRLAQPRRR